MGRKYILLSNLVYTESQIPSNNDLENREGLTLYNLPTHKSQHFIKKYTFLVNPVANEISKKLKTFVSLLLPENKKSTKTPNWHSHDRGYLLRIKVIYY